MASRRTDGEGTHETTATGKHRYRGYLKGVRVSSLSFNSKKAAYDDFKRAIREAKAANDRPKPPPVDPGSVRLADYCQATLDGKYTERLNEGKLALRTWELYESIVANHLDGDLLGETPLKDIEAKDIESWWRSLQVAAVIKDGKIVQPARAMMPASQLRYVGFLSGIFELARREKIIAANPVRDAEKPEVDPDDVDFTIYSFEQTLEILDHVHKWEEWQDTTARPKAGPRPDHIRGRLVLATQLALHGFGPSEICGTSKEDLVDGGIKPKSQAQRGELINRLKAKRRKYWVPVDEELLALIEAAPPGLLLRTDREGKKPVGDNNLRRAFHGSMKGTPYEGANLYDLRHTFAMRLLEEGVDVQTAAELMRNTTEVFLRRYVRSREDLKRDAVKRARGGSRRQPTQGTNPRTEDAA